MRVLLTALLCALCASAGFSQSIVSGEYYFDNDPGVGNGMAFALTPSDSVTWNGPVSVASLTAGNHTLYVRFKNNLGRWSLSEGRFFLVAALPLLNNNIVAGEYFFNTEPGIGNGTALAISPADSVTVTTAINVSGLPEGYNALFVRFKNTTGQWSLYERRTFHITTVANNPSIVAAEYFIGTDPGVGNGTPVTVTNSADSVQIIADITVPSLPLGEHELFIRARDSNGKWSLFEPRVFDVGAIGVTPVDNPKLKATLYPNPSVSVVALTYELPNAGMVRIEVIDALGKTHLTLDAGAQIVGKHEQRIDVQTLAAGDYFVKVISDNATRSLKMTVLR